MRREPSWCTLTLQETSTLGGLYDCRDHPHPGSPGHHRADPRSVGHPRSWQKWVERYENKGYRVLAPAYPGFEVEVEALNADPSPIEALTIPGVVEHLEGIVGELDSLRCEIEERTTVGIGWPFWLRLWSASSSPSRQCLGYGIQVGRQHPPAHPSTEALLPFIPTAAQIFATLHDAYTPLDPRPKPRFYTGGYRIKTGELYGSGSPRR